MLRFPKRAGLELSVTHALTRSSELPPQNQTRGTVLQRREAMKFLRYLLVLLLFSCAFAHFTMAQQVLKVRIDAKELDRALLFQKLNEHGADHHMRFELVKENFDYRVAYGTGQAGGPYGPVATASVTRVFDARGAELFNFTRDNRKTDAGAANATAKEIIKRIRQLRAAG
jgi:hypothetical protein